LSDKVGDVIGSEGSRGIGFLDGGGNGFRSVIAYEFEEFANLARQGTIAFGQFA